MRWFTMLLILALAAPAIAADLAATQPRKPAAIATPSAAVADVIRQGGDTMADAVTLTVPYDGGGTTTGYHDDYDID